MLPEMGVGVTYTPDLENFILQHQSVFNVLEIEPQTMWIETGDEKRPFQAVDKLFEHLASLPGKKIVHSIGAPVGGSVLPDKRQFGLLRQIIEQLGSPYASEHLSFNTTHDFNTGFFLPPRQTKAGVKAAVQSIQILRDAIGVPLAVETGVNYLRPRSDEIPDGDFFAAVAEKADCGILLDLHNLFANEINGRQKIRDFIQSIPLHRVWEVHLAGGFERDGYYLDSHSGSISDELYDVSAQIISLLPNLKTIIFEIFPSFLPITGHELVKREVEKLHQLWTLKGSKSAPPVNHFQPLPVYDDNQLPAPEDWEFCVGKLSIGHPAKQNPLYDDLITDPAVPVIRKLITEFRGSMLVGVLPLTCRLIILSIGDTGFMTILDDFWKTYSPRQYAISEALGFSEYLDRKGLRIPSLNSVLEFEVAVVQTLTDNKNRVVSFDFNPFPLLQALAERKLPEREAELGNYEIEITPEVYNDLAENGKYTHHTFRFH